MDLPSEWVVVCDKVDRPDPDFAIVLCELMDNLSMNSHKTMAKSTSRLHHVSNIILFTHSYNRRHSNAGTTYTRGHHGTGCLS